MTCCGLAGGRTTGRKLSFRPVEEAESLPVDEWQIDRLERFEHDRILHDIRLVPRRVTELGVDDARLSRSAAQGPRLGLRQRLPLGARHGRVVRDAHLDLAAYDVHLL